MLELLEDRITPSGFLTLYSFTGGSDGANPKGGVTLDSNGNLYGATALKGLGRGTLYEISSKGSFTNLYSFTTATGGNPQDAPIRDSSGNLYGTTYVSGTGSVPDGTVFEYSANGTYATLHTFSPGIDGAFPIAGLIMDDKGDLFGTTTMDSSNDGGSVFELSPNGSGGYNFATLYSFGASLQAYSGVVVDSAGNLYGTAFGGGAGVAYKLSPDGSGGYTYSTLHNFGGNPIGGLILDGKGNLYGTTFDGGTGGEGSVFKLSTDGSSFNTLYSFAANGSAGAEPEDDLFIDPKGNLYGTTYQGGASNDGVVFELSPNGSGDYTNTTLHTFGGSDGANPYAGLVTDGNGNLYGTTTFGGTNNDGTVFELTGVLPAPTMTTGSNASATFSPSAQNVTLTADVASDSAKVNEGTVTFTVLQGSTVIGTATTSNTVSNGQASVSYALPAGLTAGAYTIDAVYNSGPDFTDSSDTTHTLTVLLAPTVTTNPTKQTVTAGQTATFTAAANGYPTPTVQWQVSTDGGKTFTNINGATSTTLTLTSVTATMNGDEYQAVFTNSIGTATTSAATLTVDFAPTVTTNPSNQTVTAGQTVTFTVAANANPTATVQWQVSTDGGKTFTDISGATDTTLTLNAVAVAMNGDEYQAVFTNSIGTATTSVAALSVQHSPVVTTAPSSQTVTAGQNATFTVDADGNPTPTVQWQVSTDGGTTWNDIKDATSSTLILSNVQASQNGHEYQAVFTNSIGTTTTTAATLSVQFTPTITTNPSNQTVTAGGRATFTAAANGNPTPTVQWQVRSSGATAWTDISGASSTTLTLNNVLFAQNDNEYRAAFTNNVGSSTTTAATLTVATTPAITSGNNAAFTVGQGGSFTVTATGSPAPTLTESGALPSGVAFTDNGNGTATLSGTPAADTQAAYLFTITADNAAGSITQSFTLTINPAPLTPSPPLAPPSAPMSLNVPPLLALFDSLLGGTETVNVDGTETITDSLFGISLVVATYDGSGILLSATLLGFEIPNWVWSL